MSIQLSIKDTLAITLDELLVLLPHSKAKKEVDAMKERISELELLLTTPATNDRNKNG